MTTDHKALVIVPAQATDEMVLAGMDYPYAAVPSVLARDVYRIMIQAFDPITWEEARAQIIRELIEKAEAESWTAGLCVCDGTIDQEDHAAQWLKSQLAELAGDAS